MNPSSVADRTFTRAEFETRLARLRRAMRQHGVRLMVIDDSEILTYFIGFETSLNLYRACLVPLEGTPTMVLRKLDVAPFQEQAWCGAAIGFEDLECPEQAVTAAIRSLGHEGSSIGVDFGSHAMTVKSYQAIRAALPEANFVAMTHIPWELRLIKSQAEIARIARAAEIADSTMMAIAAAAQPGLTTRATTALAATEFVARGGDAQYVGRIAAAKGWDFLHSPLSDAPLERGDVLHVELAPSFAGYSARLMRCIVIGPIEQVRAQGTERLAALQDSQFEAMRPGALAADVDRVLREGVLRERLRNSYANITGYTLGYYSNQPLRSSDFTRTFHPDAEWRLEVGMVFHMYASAGGVSLSETIVIDPNGARRLTTAPRSLFSSE
jgi:Xaa-Pro aminopeptidase